MNTQAPLAPLRRATYQDVIDAPAHMVAEIVDGALSLQPRPAPRHSRAAGKLFGLLDAAFDGDALNGPGGWWILVEPELHLGEDVLAPDLAGWRRERMPVFPETAAIDLAPDWVCEVLSPSTRRLDLTGKRAAYGRAGVPHLWFVDPLARTLEAFAHDPAGWRLVAALADAAEVRLAPFDAIAFALSTLWPD